MPTWPNEGPSYAIDWTAHPDTGDAISGVVWTAAPAGLTIGSSFVVAGKAPTWIEGGLAGATHVVTCRATTTGGRQMDRSGRPFVTERREECGIGSAAATN